MPRVTPSSRAVRALARDRRDALDRATRSRVVAVARAGRRSSRGGAHRAGPRTGRRGSWSARAGRAARWRSAVGRSRRPRRPRRAAGPRRSRRRRRRVRCAGPSPPRRAPGRRACSENPANVVRSYSMTGSAMNVPPLRPVRRWMRLRSCSSASAWRTVSRLTPNSLASSRSGGEPVARCGSCPSGDRRRRPSRRSGRAAAPWTARPWWSTMESCATTSPLSVTGIDLPVNSLWYRHSTNYVHRGETMIDRARVVVIGGRNRRVFGPLLADATGLERRGRSSSAPN